MTRQTIVTTIDAAFDLDTESSMYQLANAKNKLNLVAEHLDPTTEPELANSWGFAMEHLNDTIADQTRMATAGKPTRIM